MRNGDAIAEAGRAEFFAGDQAFENVLAVQVGQLARHQVGYLFEYTFLTASRHVHQGTAGGQDIFESDHRREAISAGRSALLAVDLLFLVLDELTVEFVGQ
ncbi:hypothetical protein D3C86_1776350 [compost metagenome]